MDREMRRQCRMAMRGVPERLGLSFAGGNIEMRAKPNGTAAGTSFEWSGYAAVYGVDFPMWDPRGERYTESVAPGACKQSLANPNLDVPFLIGHNEAGIPLARTKSGTMQLAEDTHGLHVHVPSMDGRREEVRALASAVERGDMSEMSLAFVCLTPPDQQWDASFEHRTVREMDIHRGDVCAVVHGANQATAGVSMFPAEQLSFRRPAAIGGPHLLGGERRMPTQPYTRGADETVTCPQCQSGNDADAAYCDQCGTELNASAPYSADADETQVCPWCRLMNDTDAKICDQCGRGLVNDHDGDDMGYGGGVASVGYAAGRPLELRASAEESLDLSSASDYDAAAAPHPMAVAHAHADGTVHSHGVPQHDHGQGAMVTVDDSTGIPGEEVQMAAARKLEYRMRELELELEELASAR
jgi:HK97 family phage prohead protease